MLSAVTLVSTQAGGSAGVGSNGESIPVAISSNGQYTLFISTANNLLSDQVDLGPLDPSNVDLFRHDKLTGNILLVSRVAGTTLTAGNDVQSAVMSDDGRFIAYNSTATNLVAGQNNSSADSNNVFLFDALNQTTTLISHNSTDASTTANGESMILDISADGRHLLFRSDATNLIPGGSDTNGGLDLFWYDTQASSNKIKLVSHAANSLTTAANNQSFLFPVPETTNGATLSDYREHRYLSDDGRYVLFFSLATNLVTGQTDTNSSFDVFRWDSTLSANTTILVSHASGSPSTAGNFGSDQSMPQISSDGRYITFQSLATNLINGVTDTNGAFDVFQYDADAQTTTLISYAASSTSTTASTGGSAGSRYVSTSADGSVVAYTGFFTNIITGQVDNNLAADTFLWIRDNNGGGSNALITKQAGTTATTSNQQSFTSGVAPAVSNDGSAVIIQTDARNLVAGQSNPSFASNIFHYNVGTGQMQQLSHTTSSETTSPDDSSFYPFVSGNGLFIVFASTATNLVSGHSGSNRDVFLTSPSLPPSPPTTSGIADINALEDASPIQVDLWAAFADTFDIDSQLTYSVTGNTNSSLVTTSIQNSGHGQYLILTLGANQNGSSTITVRALDSEGLSVTTSFTLNVTAVYDAPTFGDLQMSFTGILIRGTSLQLNLPNVNDADGNIEEVRFYRDANDNGTFDVDDILLGTVEGPFDLQSTVNQAVDTTNLPIGESKFFAVAEDSLGLQSTVSSIANVLYRPVASQKGKAQWTDAGGQIVNATLAGPGSFVAYFDTEATNANPFMLDVSGTKLASTLTVAPKLKGATTTVGSFFVGYRDNVPFTDLGSLQAPLVKLGSTLDIEGGLRRLTLNDCRGDYGNALIIGSTATKQKVSLTVTLGRARDVLLQSQTPILNLTATEWVKSDAGWANLLIVKSIGAVKTIGSKPLSLAGDFIADITIANNPGPRTLAIGPVNVAGQLGGKWSINGSVSSIRAASFRSDWIADFTQGDSTTGQVASLTSTLGNFASDVTARSIGSVSVKGNFTGKLTLMQALDPKRQALNSLTVAGGILGATISSTGNLGTITTSTLGQGSLITAGITLNSLTLPSALNEFSSPTATLRSITVTGKPTPANPSFGQAIVAAGIIRSVSLKVIDTNAAVTDYGFAADKIDSVARTGAATLRKLDTGPEAGRNGKFVLILV